jgi:hypothetical protein
MNAPRNPIIDESLAEGYEITKNASIGTLPSSSPVFNAGGRSFEVWANSQPRATVTKHAASAATAALHLPMGVGFAEGELLGGKAICRCL